MISSPRQNNEKVRPGCARYHHCTSKILSVAFPNFYLGISMFFSPEQVELLQYIRPKYHRIGANKCLVSSPSKDVQQSSSRRCWGYKFQALCMNFVFSDCIWVIANLANHWIQFLEGCSSTTCCIAHAQSLPGNIIGQVTTWAVDTKVGSWLESSNLYRQQYSFTKGAESDCFWNTRGLPPCQEYLFDCRYGVPQLSQSENGRNPLPMFPR